MSYEVFERLCKAKGVTPAEVSRQTGIATSTLTNWKHGRYTPKAKKMQQIADYFGVSVEYLTTGENSTAPYYLNDDARELAQFLFENPDYKVLFDASRKVKREDIAFVKEMIERTRK